MSPLFPRLPAPPGSAWLKRRLAARVSDVFNDRTRGETPVVRQADGLFAPDSVVRRVHGDVVAMMAGGIAALLLQMLHPAVLAGVWDHSRFRDDMHGRLRRTARFVAQTTYGQRDDALAAIARVRRIHDRVSGLLPDGTPYRANDPSLLAWVHLTETTSFLAGWRRFAEPLMPEHERNQYFDGMARIGTALGAAPVPHTEHAAYRQMAAMRGALGVDARTREICEILLTGPPAFPGGRHAVGLMTRAGIDLLPPWARQMHGFAPPGPATPLVRAGTFGLAETVRWAFRA
nr:oxygenase MpaB family protein [Gluconacetobacter tumulisoli]